MGRVVIRQILPGDLSALVALDREVFGAAAAPGFYFRQLHDIFPEGQLLAADGERVVGYVLSSPSRDQGAAWILALGVASDARANGLGGQLLERALAALVGCHEVLLTVAPRSPAVRLYERHGFVRERVEDDYFGDGDARLVMCRRSGRGAR